MKCPIHNTEMMFVTNILDKKEMALNIWLCGAEVEKYPIKHLIMSFDSGDKTYFNEPIWGFLQVVEKKESE